jgi:hypothetical protein
MESEEELIKKLRAAPAKCITNMKVLDALIDPDTNLPWEVNPEVSAWLNQTFKSRKNK